VSRFVVCNGMYRSGSTLVYNIARELLELNFGDVELIESTPYCLRDSYGRFVITYPTPPPMLAKVHFYVLRGRQVDVMREARFLFTYRNPLDIAASAQKRCTAQTGEWGEYIPDGWDRYEDDYFDQLHWKPCLMIKYEEMILDVPRVVCMVSNFLDLHVTLPEAREIARRHSAEVVKAHADTMPNDTIKNITNVRDHHISDDLGKPDTWRKHLSAATIRACVAQCGRMMKHAGYEIPEVEPCTSSSLSATECIEPDQPCPT